MMTDTALPHRLDRTITIRAPRASVFAYFTDSARWSAWWGEGSTIEPRQGGQVYIRHPNGIEMSGEVLSIDPGNRIAFTYGYVSGAPIPVGGSRVTISCADAPAGTQVTLVHEFSDVSVRDAHNQGWRYQFSVFANVVANDLHARAADLVDAWHEVWTERDADRRAAQVAAIASPAVRFEDRYSAVEGAAELLPHITATHRFMPGVRLERAGPVRHCQGTVLADWIVRSEDGQERGRGTNVYVLGADGRIVSVTGLSGG